jgi:hypothetical protein
MEAVNAWVWDNLLLALILNVAGAIAFVYIIVRLAYKAVRKQPISVKEWVVGIVAVAIVLAVFVLTGLDSSPISLWPRRIVSQINHAYDWAVGAVLLKKRKPKSFFKYRRGDTLVEVTFALVVLTVVLLGAATLGVRALQQSGAAGGRTSMANEAGRQMENLRNFRDNHTWREFLYGDAAGNFSGVLNAATAGGCQVLSQCFQMELKSIPPGTMQWVPRSGSLSGTVPQSYIETQATAGPGTTPRYVEINIEYGFASQGGGATNRGHIKTKLSELNAASSPAPWHMLLFSQE